MADEEIPPLDFTDEELAGLIRGIHAGTITPDNLPANLYNAIAENLKDGLYKGFGGTVEDFTGDQLELLEELRENIYMFSAAKTFQQVSDMSDALADPEGGVRSFSDFKQAAADIYSKYNGGSFLQDDEKAGYLQSEYETVIASGQQANLWKKIEADKDVLPYITIEVVEDANTCEDCGPLNGLTLPIDDPLVDAVYPPLHNRCRCTASTTDDDSKLSSEEELSDAREHVDENIDPLFQQNVGKTGMVFDEDHPYFSVPREYQALAERNFDLPIPSFDSEYFDPVVLKQNVDKLLETENMDTERLFSKGGKYIPERVDFQRGVVDNFIKDGSTIEGTSYFMGGAPATGKSSLLEKGLVKLPAGILTVDADAIKAELPEYGEMINRNSNLAAKKVHEESSKISKDLLAAAAKQKYDISLDAVNDGEYEKLTSKIQQQRKAGKKVEGYYITTSVDNSLKRAAERFEKTGREVPEEYIRDMHREISRLIPKLAANKDFDVLRLYDNNGVMGSVPSLIFEQVGDKVTIYDKAKYKAFLAQGN